jgi:hypothetical protein
MERILDEKHENMRPMDFMRAMAFLSDNYCYPHQEETTIIAEKNLEMRNDYKLYVQ